MNKSEFEIKWVKDSLMSAEADKEIMKDLNEVIKDELLKFSIYYNIYTTPQDTWNEIIESYLNQK